MKNKTIYGCGIGRVIAQKIPCSLKKYLNQRAGFNLPNGYLLLVIRLTES